MAVILSGGRYFGSVVGRRKAGPLTFTETAYSGNERIPRHCHDRSYMCFVVRGSYREQSTDRATPCRSDMIVFHPAGTEHSDRFGQIGGTCLNLEWDPSWLADSDTGLDRLSRSSYVDAPDIAWLTRRLRAEVRASAAYSDVAIHGLSRALVAAIAREAYHPDEASVPAWVRAAVALVEREFARGPGLTEVAAHVGVHPTHLARVFRERLGTSVGEFVRQRRVEAAARLLVSSDRSLSEIGYETGFSDQSHFTRTFQRHVGMTPGEYRRSRGPR